MLTALTSFGVHSTRRSIKNVKAFCSCSFCFNAKLRNLMKKGHFLVSQFLFENKVRYFVVVIKVHFLQTHTLKH